MKILVTGASGQLGFDVCRELTRRGIENLGLASKDMDITDPAAVALGYGRANAALGMLWPILDHNFKVKRHAFQVSLDYGRGEPGVELRAAVTLTVGQAAALGLRYGTKALAAWFKSGRTPRKKQEALSHE